LETLHASTQQSRSLTIEIFSCCREPGPALQAARNKRMSSTIAPIRAASSHPELNDSYRLVIFDGTGTDVYLCEENGCWFFPEVQIPKFTRVLAEIGECVRKRWNIGTAHLFSNSASSDSFKRFYTVLEAPRQCGQLSGLTKCDVLQASSLLENREDVKIFRSCCTRVLRREGVYRSGPFSRLGWIYTLQEWVQHVPGVGNIVSFSQLSGSGDTCLIRFETPSKPLWYKAVGQSDPREFSITEALSDWLPQYLPRILSFDSNLNAWLMESGGETSLSEHLAFDTWVSIARRLATMQIDSICHATGLQKRGAIDLRAANLQELIDPFFEFMGILMQGQVRNPPPPLTGNELTELAEVLRFALSELAAIAIPDVIGHVDFNPGNILVGTERSVFIDWSSAYVGSPLLTVEYLIAHFKKNCNVLPGQERSLRRGYREQWLSVLPESDMRRAQHLSPLIAVFASAVAEGAWRDPARLAIPGVSGYMRSLARIMKREMQQLMQRRSLA
jgi:hypothetical protein